MFTWSRRWLVTCNGPERGTERCARRVRFVSTWLLTITVVVAVGVGRRADAQPPATAASPAVSEVAGIVRSAVDGHALAGATVLVEGTTWRTLTDTDGRFTIRVPLESSYVQVRRIGFAPARILVGPGARDQLDVRLSTMPGELAGIEVRADPDRPFVSTSTATMLRNTPALGEADVFRTLPLLAGVAQPNDLLNRHHLAGGASDEHAITLDGHPLQAPFHLASVFGSFNVTALERADVIMHHRSSADDGYLSGELALRTRRPDGSPVRDVVVTLLSASATVVQPLPGGWDVLVSGRHTYIDQVLRRITKQNAQGGDDLLLPGFGDALVRVGRTRPLGWTLEGLGYATRDRAQVSNPFPGERPLSWGEQLLGLTAAYRRPTWTVEGRASRNRSYVDLVDLYSASGLDSIRLNTTDLTQDWWTGVIGGERRWEALSVRTDVSVRYRDHDHRWSPPFSESHLKSGAPAYSATRSRQTVSGVGVELASAQSVGWQWTAGTHLSGVNGRTYVAPRLSASHGLSDHLRLSGAWNRRFQFDAIAGEPEEGTVTQPVFFLAAPRRADVAALSLDWRPSASPSGRRLTASASVYHRRYRDRTTLADTAAALVNPYDFPLASAATSTSQDSSLRFVRRPGETVGATLTAEASTLRGGVVRVSYTLQRARTTIDGRAQPTTWDAPHQIAAFAALPLSKRWSLTSAVQMRSGSATTPVALRLFVPPLNYPVPDLRFLYAAPNSARFPGYLRVDVGTRYRFRAQGAEWTASAQVLNAFNRTNGLAYDMREYIGCVAYPGLCTTKGVRRRSLPVLPSIGMEVRW